MLNYLLSKALLKSENCKNTMRLYGIQNSLTNELIYIEYILKRKQQGFKRRARPKLALTFLKTKHLNVMADYFINMSSLSNVKCLVLRK